MSTNKIKSNSVLWKLEISDKFTNTNKNDNTRSSGATLTFENTSTRMKLTREMFMIFIELQKTQMIIQNWKKSN